MKKFSPKEKMYLAVERRKVKIPIVSNLPELLDKLKNTFTENYVMYQSSC